MAEKDIWRTFILPATSFIDKIEEKIRLQKPEQILILGHSFYQEILEEIAHKHHIPTKKKTLPHQTLGRNLKKDLVKRLASYTIPAYLRKPTPKQLKTSPAKRKKIIIAHDSIHPAKVVPWAQALHEEFDLLFVGQEQDQDIFTREGIPFRKQEDYLTGQTIKKLISSKKQFKQMDTHFLADIRYKEVLAGPSFDELFTFLSHARFYHIAAFAEMFSAMIEKEKPDLIITIDEISTHGKVLINVCKQKKTPCVIMEHGIYIKTPLLQSLATAYLAYGKWSKEILTAMHVPEQKIKVVGMPEEKKHFQHSGEEVRKAYNIPKNKRIFLITSQGISYAYNYPFLDTVYQAVQKFPHIPFLTKLHPDEEADLHEQLIAKYNLKNVTIIPHGTIALEKLLDSSHCLINFYSAVNIEALARGKFLLNINVNNIPDDILPTPVPGLIVTARNVKETINAINTFLKSTPKEKEIQKLSTYYIACDDKKACDNIVKEIGEILKGKKS